MDRKNKLGRTKRILEQILYFVLLFLNVVVVRIFNTIPFVTIDAFVVMFWIGYFTLAAIGIILSFANVTWIRKETHVKLQQITPILTRVILFIVSCGTVVVSVGPK